MERNRQTTITQVEALIMILLIGLYLIAAYGYTGQEKEAQDRVKQLLRLQPKFSLEEFGRNAPFEDEVLKERLFKAWRKAGLK